MSRCAVNGPIHNFVAVLFPGIRILACDGVGIEGHPAEYPEDAEWVGALATRIPKDNLVLMPLDDDVFERGLFPDTYIPSWEERQPVLYWRGGASGDGASPSLRHRFVAALDGVPHTDCKITRWGGWENGQNIPEHLLTDRVSVEHHFNYKYIPIVDGNAIASNHMWAFGSGAVPLLVSHPDNDFWFRPYIQPWVHYVPVSYDLSDLCARIDWLVSHDEEASHIAKRALSLSRRIFTPEHQREHLRATKKRMEEYRNGRRCLEQNGTTSSH